MYFNSTNDHTKPRRSKTESLTGQALLEEHQIQSLARPSGTAFEVFKRNFTTPKDGTILVGHDEKIVMDPEDLVALVRSPDDDRLTRLLRYTCGYWLRVRLFFPTYEARI
jgi:hypothetical protein